MATTLLTHYPQPEETAAASLVSGSLLHPWLDSSELKVKRLKSALHTPGGCLQSQEE